MGLQKDITLDEVVGDMRRVVVDNTPDSSATWWVLVGPLGAVQFAYLTHTTEVSEILGKIPGHRDQVVKDGYEVMGMDVGYHSYEPMYDEQSPMNSQECDWLVGQKHCYYDGSGLRADHWLQEWALFDFDPEWVWTTLHDEYNHLFLMEREA